MANKKMTYEGMFLVDPGEFQAASEPVRNILARSEAEVLAIKPWDERRLAYEILGRKRAPMTSGRRTEDIEVQRDEEEDDRDRRPRRRPEPVEEAVEDIAEEDSDSEK